MPPAKGSNKLRSGFASMDETTQRRIAADGGRTAHQMGTAHEFTSEEARVAGRKGALAISGDSIYMSELGRRGGRTRSVPAASALPPTYLLLSVKWSLHHGSLTWYRPRAAGYTEDEQLAGRYSSDEAARHCAGTHGEVVSVEAGILSRHPSIGLRTLVRLSTHGKADGLKLIRPGG